MSRVSRNAADQSSFASHFLSRYVQPAVADQDFSNVKYHFHKQRSLALYQCSRNLATPSSPKPDYMLRLHLSKTEALHEVSYGDGWLRRQPESLLFAPPNLESQVRGNIHNPFSSLILVFPEAELRKIAGEILESEGEHLLRPPTKEFHDPHIAALMRQLWTSASAGTPAESVLVEGTFISLVARLLLRGERKRVAFPKHESSASLITQKALDFMKGQLTEKITLEEIAAAAGVSRSYLTQVFSQSTGKSVHTHLIELRIQRAKQLILRHGKNLTLDEIANQSGFWNGTHLTRMFVRHVGVTPQVFREQV